ncbi:MAG: quinolinate synthase NadA [Bacteroidota bacterium]|nr:quinolinate synthase NadA [Bacteroidota bacterium]
MQAIAQLRRMLTESRKSLYDRINRLKKEKNVVVLAHYYMSPELQLSTAEGGCADFLGDSLGLSLEAQKTNAENIMFCGVRFMAETALIVSPDKKVFMPDVSSGCSLASSISAKDIIELRKKYPGLPVMGYINTYAETKAELDICCTSRNAVSIAGSLDSDKIIFVPDIFMGQNLKEAISKKYNKDLILWNGTCEVHEQFRNETMNVSDDADVEMLMHWEVPGDTAREQLKIRKGVVGSTGDILNYVKNSNAKKFYLASECDLGESLKKSNADKEFITPCIKCPYMKQNTLEKLLASLESIGTDTEDQYRITLDAHIIERARIPVLKMLQFN